jgi:hypothetical protein
MPDGFAVELLPGEQDGLFADVVCDGATHEPTDEERRAMRDAPTLLQVHGPGGSLAAAIAMLRVGSALIDTGGSGVLVHNSGLGHGAQDWRTLANDPDGGPHWAFVATVRSDKFDGIDGPSLFTTGMHCLGHRDVVLPATGDDEADWFAINNFCGYLERSGRTPVDGDVLTVLAGGTGAEVVSDAGDSDLDFETGDDVSRMIPMQRVRYAECRHIPTDSPLHNPYGLYVLLPLDPDDLESYAYRPSR